MSVKNLIICDEENSYVHFLVENILEKEELQVEVRACTNWDIAKGFLRERPADILLVGEKWQADAKKEAGVGEVVALVKDLNRQEECEQKEIYKYQCADVIVAGLFENKDVFRNLREEEQKIVAVYSPVHRAGKTYFATALGKELSKKKKVLYLNLEEYPGLEFHYVDYSRENLGDLLYYLKQEQVDMGLRMGAMVQVEDKMEYLLPMQFCDDLKHVTEEEWMQLLLRLRETEYEIIILDLGESIQGLWKLLEQSERIYMPVLDDFVSEMKLKVYEDNLHKQGRLSLLHKTRKLEVKGDMDETVRRIAREDFGSS